MNSRLKEVLEAEAVKHYVVYVIKKEADGTLIEQTSLSEFDSLAEAEQFGRDLKLADLHTGVVITSRYYIDDNVINGEQLQEL